ncbi:MAG: UDP-2,3-diacylglucosamine diphosphatase [Bdellovibrionales bacterium]
MGTGYATVPDLLPTLPPVIQALPKLSKIGAVKPPKKKDRLQPRGVFISDIHFGSPVELASNLAAFLGNIRKPKFLILAGDIFDFWSFGKKLLFERPVFSQAEFLVLQQISLFDLKGTQVVYIPGNHDSIFRTFAHYMAGRAPKIYGRNLRILREAVYETADHRRFLVLHGDEFDPVVTKRQKLSQAAAKIFDWMIYAGARWDMLQRSNATVAATSSYLRLPTAGQTLKGIKARFDRATRTQEYQRKQIERLFAYNAAVFAHRLTLPANTPAPPYLDGIIGGHTHCVGLWSAVSPTDTETGLRMGPQKVFVYDLGHWTGPYEDGQSPPSCTALIEHMHGGLELMRWSASSTIVPVNAVEQPLDALLSPATSGNSFVSLRQRVAKSVTRLLRLSPA